MTARQRTLPRRRSFTLVELLVVVVLLGLAASLVVPHLLEPRDAARLRAVQGEVEQSLRLAQLRATTRHTVTWLEFDRDSSRLRIRSAGDDPNLPWRSLSGVTLGAAEFKGGRADAGATFRVPVKASGGAPWAIELQTGHQAAVLWNDGLGEECQLAADTRLREFRWPDQRKSDE